MLSRSLGREEPLEEGVATHSRILAWRIPSTEDPGWLQSIGSQRVRHNWSDLAHLSTYCCVWVHGIHTLCTGFIFYILLFILWLKKINVCKKEESPLQAASNRNTHGFRAGVPSLCRWENRRNLSQVTQRWVTEAELGPAVHIPEACRTQNWCLSLTVCTK